MGEAAARSWCAASRLQWTEADMKLEVVAGKAE